MLARYIGSRLQRVRLQREPGNNEQFFSVEKEKILIDINVKKNLITMSTTYKTEGFCELNYSLKVGSSVVVWNKCICRKMF